MKTKEMKGSVIMPRLRTSTKIKRWFSRNWKIVIAIILILLFFYILASA